jgi:TRAP-type C4-dicarboxylate transport system substrate-binding protein
VDSILAPLFQKKNVKILYYSAYGENGICGKAAIENLEDIKGLKIRAPVPGALACLATWGATPTKIAAAEVYDAIAKGAIDGCVTSWSSMYARKFYEVTNHFVGPIMRSVWVNFINLNTWKSLPADIQKIIMEVSRDTEERSITIMKAFDVKSLNKLKEVGTVKILTPAEKISWATPLKSTYDAWVKKCDDKGYGNEARRILEAIEKAR